MTKNKIMRPNYLTSVQISPSLFELAREHNIKWVDAMRVGISIMLAEKGVREYENNLNIVRLCREYKKKAGEFAQKAADLEQKS